MQRSGFHKKKGRSIKTEDLIEGLLAGDIYSLSKAITLCESTKEEDRIEANKIIKACLPKSGKSIRIGISGVPGVGKSTFIESFGSYLIEDQKKKVAVLAVDPSSEKSKGSILGDKTRMEKLSRSDNAYIRPTAAGGALGGVAHGSRESILLCEAAGFELILIETVGVGQSETEVRQMSDFFLLLMLAGAGDELQGIKRGIMEMADALVINKADGDNVEASKMAKRNYQNALHLFPPSENGWTPLVESCSALHSQNMDTIWNIVEDFEGQLKKDGHWELQRKEQSKTWLRKSVRALLERRLFAKEDSQKLYLQLEEQVSKGEIAVFEAAETLVEKIMQA